MGLRILFLNPGGTDMYDKYMSDVMSPYANPDTDLVVRSLNDVPKTPFLPSPNLLSKQLRVFFITVNLSIRSKNKGEETRCIVRN